ncbi:hypothetical protein OH491_02220 [Termitidicoccus mucosus]|uniref:Glycoside hydrolase family 42 N-terminal domain-containing protein n=1 Tax=Termitidicoccus mucosus TaxID=1184151 RepID=A0A178INF2_9BACT|nr:hypothetical protein AW736_07335 [Opitutaceae bacterium TSB47]
MKPSRYSFPRPSLPFSLAVLFFLGLAAADAEPFRIQRDVSAADRGGIPLPKDWKDPGTGPLPAANFTADYDFEVPEDGWYVLSFQHMPSLAREVFVDGRRVSLYLGLSMRSAAEWAGKPMEAGAGWTKEASLPLTAGRHTLTVKRVGRMSFPAGFARAWKIETAGESPRDRVEAFIAGRRELRRGEPLLLRLTGGGGNIAAVYDIVRIDEMSGRETPVARAEFPASPEMRVLDLAVPCDEEGVFTLAAKSGGEKLGASDFITNGGGTYFVIDTAAAPAPGADAGMKRRLVFDIDCVANTVNGAPVRAGKNYWEANGATRVVAAPAGRYRESNDGRGPDVDPHPRAAAENFSGFAYLLENVAPGRPLVIEIEHPDDDWRSVCVSIVDVFERSDAGKMQGYLPPTFGYETGGYLPLSNTMLTETVMFWPNGRDVHLGLVSSRLGKRAAAARIRVFEVEGELPPGGVTGGGRVVGMWMEEHERWHTHFNTPKNAGPAARDFIGLKRTMEWLAHTGVNAFWPTAVAYQQCTYDSPILDGFLLKPYNIPRLSALLCEKHRIGYLAEIFLARLRYFDEHVMTEGVENPSDLYTRSWWGFSMEGREPGGTWPYWNVLHPRVQDMMISIYGELADSLADTSSFIGLSGRLDAWQWEGLYALTGMDWGYEDWTVRRFENETGIAVPDGGDPEKRFEARHRFLTGEKIKPRWVAWRGEKVTGFLLRLAERMRQAKPGVVFYLCGDGRQDENHGLSLSENILERMAGSGIDLEKLSASPGVGLLPTAAFGRGKTFTYLADQRSYDRLRNPEYSKAGYNRERGFALYGAYQEWGPEFPLAKLGAPLPRWHYCSSSAAAGVNALEPLASALAGQDSMVIREGGYPLIYGRREFHTRWMEEFSRLPRRPFEPVEFARDPVAVWQREEPDKLLFYAVNREHYPVGISLEIAGAGAVTPLGRAGGVPMKNGSLKLKLEPYQLLSFEAPAGAVIRSARVAVPEEKIAFVRGRLAFARGLLDRIERGPFKESLSGRERRRCRDITDEAAEAFARGAYWRARTLLSSAPMMAAYEKTGRYPDGQVETRFPNLMENLAGGRFEPDDPFIDADALARSCVPGGCGGLVDSETFNPEWRFARVATAKAGVIEVELEAPAPALYQLYIGHVARAAGPITVALGGKPCALPAEVCVPGAPEKSVMPPVLLPGGRTRVRFEGADGFGIYALKLVPQLRALDTTRWAAAGPFEGFWKNAAMKDENVKRGMETVYGPENDASPTAVFRNENNRALRWTTTGVPVGTHEDAGVNFATRAGLPGYGIGYAQTFIESPDDRDVLIYIGTDWWANAWLNGEQLKPAGNEKIWRTAGAWFNAWKPRPAAAKLKKGVNRLLVKNQGGSLYSWFTCHITDAGGLRIEPDASPLAR